MRCSNCGKEVAYTGQICPYCKANKQGDQLTTGLLYIYGYGGGFVGAVVGYLVYGFLGGLGGLVLGCIIGGIAGASKGGKMAAQLKANQAQLAAEEWKQCPYCEETVKRDAIKCRFCKSDIAPEEELVAAAARTPKKGLGRRAGEE